MGATRLASGKMQCSYTKQRLTDSTNYTPICEAFALITERGTRLQKKPTRDASPPLVLAFSIKLTGLKADLKPWEELLCQEIAL